MGNFHNKDDLPLDTRLLSEAIYELNISRHNVSIYPRNHPIVEESLNKAYSFLLKLFELRDEVTIAIARDTLIIDDTYLDKLNPVYMDFASCLSKNNIASLSFVRGLTKDELYSFHKFLLEYIVHASSEHVQKILNEYKFIHLKIDLIDYSVFSFKDEKSDQAGTDMPLWEKYIYGMLEGRLAAEDTSDFVQNIAPVQLASIINRYDSGEIRDESYDNVITSYVKSSRERMFSGSDLKKLLDFVDALKPELKNQFLSSSIRNISNNTDMAAKVLQEMPIDDVMNLLHHINDQLIVIPETLRNVLEKFAKIDHHVVQVTQFGDGLIEDDILLSAEITSLLSDANFSSFVSEAYQQQILRILSFDAKNDKNKWLDTFDLEWKDENIEVVLQHIMLELISSNKDGIIPMDEYSYYINALKEQTHQLIEIGHYKKVFHTITVMESISKKNGELVEARDIVEYFHSKKFISALIDSIILADKGMREDAFIICHYYSERIIPALIEALIDEQSQSVRRFILRLLTSFGEKVLPEACKQLDNARWFVKRNMLYILSYCGNNETLEKARPYCDNEHPKVRFEAMKCLLKSGNEHGVYALKEALTDKSEELMKHAINLSGVYRVKEVVPDLIRILRRKELSSRDYEDKILIVRALGQIKDPRAPEVLRSMLSSRKFLFKNAFNKLKEEIRIILQVNFSEKDADQLEVTGNKK